MISEVSENVWCRLDVCAFFFRLTIFKKIIFEDLQKLDVTERLCRGFFLPRASLIFLSIVVWFSLYLHFWKDLIISDQVKQVWKKSWMMSKVSESVWCALDGFRFFHSESSFNFDSHGSILWMALRFRIESIKFEWNLNDEQRNARALGDALTHALFLSIHQSESQFSFSLRFSDGDLIVSSTLQVWSESEWWARCCEKVENDGWMFARLAFTFFILTMLKNPFLEICEIVLRFAKVDRLCCTLVFSSSKLSKIFFGGLQSCRCSQALLSRSFCLEHNLANVSLSIVVWFQYDYIFSKWTRC